MDYFTWMFHGKKLRPLWWHWAGWNVLLKLGLVWQKRLKGLCHEIFYSGFFLEQVLLVPIDMSKHYIVFCRTVLELYVFLHESLVYSPLGSCDFLMYSPTGSHGVFITRQSFMNANTWGKPHDVFYIKESNRVFTITERPPAPRLASIFMPREQFLTQGNCFIYL